jgi:hypothetical protein
VFLIIGIIVLIANALFLYSYDIRVREPVDDTIKQPIQSIEPNQFKAYVESCIKDKAWQLLDVMSYKGGSLENQGSFNGLMYDHTWYRYLCKQFPGNGCVNTILTRNQMENELNRILKPILLDECFNFDDFRNRGYTITTGDMVVTSAFAVDDVGITVDYPTKIEKGTFSREIPEYFSKVPTPIGRLYDLAIHILNEEIVNEYFNKDVWMRDHNVEIRIEKHKPYPDVVYKLIMLITEQNKYYEFNFAVQGEDTVSRINYKTENSLHGYCDIASENNCYANADPTECVFLGGIATTTPMHCGGRSRFSEAISQ